jgi:hypothetical protein
MQARHLLTIYPVISPQDACVLFPYTHYLTRPTQERYDIGLAASVDRYPFLRSRHFISFNISSFVDGTTFPCLFRAPLYSTSTTILSPFHKTESKCSLYHPPSWFCSQPPASYPLSKWLTPSRPHHPRRLRISHLCLMNGCQLRDIAP